MRWFLPLLLLLLAACGGSDGGPNDPGDVVETPEPLDFSYLNRLPQPDDLSSVSEFEGRVIAVGNGGALVVREPGESAWRRIPSPTREAFRAVVMVDAQTILATTSAGIWLSRDGAISWKLVDTTHHMRSIAVRNGRAVIGGLFGVVASSDFESWEPAVDSPTDVIDVGFAGDSFVWVMSATEMHRSVDGGKNWVRMIESGVGGTFVAFAFADEDFGTLALANREIKGTTNGSTFTLVREVVTPVVDVDFDSTGRGVLVTRGLDVYTSDSQGKAWTFEGGVDAEQTAASITSTTDGEVLVVGLEGLIVESSGGLSTLTEISSGFGDDLLGVAFGNSLEGLAFNDGFEEDLFRTTSGGFEWARIPSPVQRTVAVAFHSDEFGLLLSSIGEIFRSNDFGQSWVDMGASSESRMESLFILDGETWMSGGNEFIVRTADAGADWGAEVVDIRVRAFDRFPGTDVMLGVGSGVIRSEDRGASWSGKVAGVVNGYGVACLNENTAVVVGNTIYRTTDQGLTWEGVLDLDHELKSVVFIDAQHGIAVGDRGLCFETLDAGLNWSGRDLVGDDLKAVVRRGLDAIQIVGEDGIVIDGSRIEQ